MPKPLEITLRQSELWEPCRRRWAISYRKRYEPIRRYPSKAETGTLVHKGLEAYYLGKDWVPAVQALWDEGAASLESEPRWLAEYVKALDLAKIMLRGYEQFLEETGADIGWIIQGVEREIKVPFGVVEVPGYGTFDVSVTGHVDLEIVDQYGLPRLVDHKTRDNLAATSADMMDLQRPTYAVLRKLEDGTTYHGAIHNVLKRVKRTSRATPPFYTRHEVHFSEQRLLKHWKLMDYRIRQLVPLAVGIENGTVPLDSPALPPEPHRDCSWRCPFLDICPMFDDGSSWDWLLESQYTQIQEVPVEADS